MITRSKSLSTIPEKKVQEILQGILASCPDCKGSGATTTSACKNCRLKITICNRYAESNIPLRYWHIKMDETFLGFPTLKEVYEEVAKDSSTLKAAYNNGTYICFVGKNGIGKTTTVCNILKSAVASSYSCLYTTLPDIVASQLSDVEDKGISRKELMMVDFLVIDEFDERHMGSEKAAELYGRFLEDIFRKRVNNNLPVFMNSNSADPKKAFTGTIKESISSLMSYLRLVSVIGKDLRKDGK